MLSAAPLCCQVGGCDQGDWAPARFDGLLSYRNGFNGVTATETGPVQFNRFIVVGNNDTGLNFRDTRSSGWDQAKVTNSLVVGRLPGDKVGTRVGFWGPFTNGLTLDNVTFANFDLAGMTVLRPCAWCEHGGSPGRYAGGYETRFARITKVQPTGWPLLFAFPFLALCHPCAPLFSCGVVVDWPWLCTD
jgi:hypothetical protein